MRVIFVHYGNVVIDVFLRLIHTAQAILNNYREFICKRGIIGYAIGNSRSRQVAMPILMLQPFSIQGRAPGRTAQQESTATHISGRPGQVADTLKAEHGIENIEWNHLHAMGAVSTCRGHP